MEIINERFWLNDFQVYYSASDAFYKHEQVYDVAFGLSSGYFKYSPFTLFAFIPYRFFNYETAKVIHFIIISIASISSFLMILKLMNPFNSVLKQRNLLPILLMILSSVHLTRELHLGNINMLLILLVLISIWLMRREKSILAGIVLCFIFFLKPYFLILILPVFVYRKWKVIMATMGSAVLFFLIQAVLTGFSRSIELYGEWLTALSTHNKAGFSEHTIASIIKSYTKLEIGLIGSVVVIGLTGLSYLGIKFIKRKESNVSSLPFDMAVLLAIIPNLVITDSQHFLFTLPLLGYLLIWLFREKSTPATIIFIILFFFYGANSNDLLGNPLSDKFDEFSTIGIANLGLIGMAIWSRYKIKLK